MPSTTGQDRTELHERLAGILRQQSAWNSQRHFGITKDLTLLNSLKMSKARRGVKFQHRGSASDHRRPSSSELSDLSEPGSPVINGDVKKPESIKEEQDLSDAAEYQKKKANFITRSIWTLAMVAGFFVAMFAGHLYILVIVTAIQIVSFKEVIAIAQVPTKQKNLPLTKSLNWYFLAITMYYLYGESVIYYFKHILLVDKVLLPFATHHRFISFMLYVMGMSRESIVMSLY